MTPQDKAASLRADLAQFYGSEHLYRHTFNGVLYTEGVRHFAETAGAYWFLDILATEPAILRQARGFAAVTLAVDDDETAWIIVTDGNENQVYSHWFGFTDCPPGTWKFFFENMTIMLPGER